MRSTRVLRMGMGVLLAGALIPWGLWGQEEGQEYVVGRALPPEV